VLGGAGVMLSFFFLSNILMLNFQEKNIFASKMQGKKYPDAIFSPIKLALFTFLTA
jgi:hypothetical protein